MTKSPSTGVGIVAPTPGSDSSESGHIAMYMLVNTLLHFHDEIHIFTRATAVMEFEHPNVHLYEYAKPYPDSPWYLRLPGQVIYQLKLAHGVVQRRGRMDVTFFRGGGYVIPMLAARLIGLVVVFRMAGVLYQQEVNASSLFHRAWVVFLAFLQRSVCRLASVVVVTSENVIEFGGIEKFRRKTFVWCHYYFDLELFDETKPYRDRDLIVGHVGVISQIKGSLNLIDAVATVAEERDLSLLIVGDGPEMERAKQRVADRNIDAEFTGRLQRADVPEQLNRMKVTVLSSVSEGVPKVVLESMACGTPPVATDVGGVADFVSHGETGFLVQDNDPEHLAEGINTALDSDLEAVSDNAREYVQERFSYDSAVREYHEFISTATPIDVPLPPENPEKPVPEPTTSP